MEKPQSPATLPVRGASSFPTALADLTGLEDLLGLHPFYLNTT